MPARTFIGIDLAWGHRARTGVAALDEGGRLLSVESLLTDDEILRWVAAQPGVPVVVAVDAPLVVPNETGQRDCERQIASAYGRLGASCHPSNTTLMPAPRGTRLAAALASSVCIEVYPHAALVGLFALPYRLLYKKGTILVRREGLLRLAALLESWPVLDLDGVDVWKRLTDAVSEAVRLVDLKRVEDQLDAVLCAGLARLWHRDDGALVVYGDLRGAHVVAPPAPAHRAVPPARMSLPRDMAADRAPSRS